MKKQFDRFVLTSLVSQDAMGQLYSGTEMLPGGTGRAVMVKVLSALAKGDPGGERRFHDEVRVLAALAGHPHVVTFYGIGVTEGTPWIATEHAPATLAQLLAPSPANPADVARMIEHVARGLSALHGLQPPMLHNRLSPGNIIIVWGDHYKITEFGLASPASSEPTLGMDSVRYAAPELLNKEFGHPGPATDLYALGHIAYEMALGVKIHRQQFPAVMEGQSDPRQVNPAKWQAWHHSLPTIVPPAHELVKGFPTTLGMLIAKLMAKPLGNRYGSTGAVLADLKGSASTSAPMPAAMMPMDIPASPAPAAPRFQPRPSMQPGASTGAPLPPPPLPAQASPMGGGGGAEMYYVRLRNRTTGPFDLAALQRMARQGQISRLHQVSADQRTWRSAATVEGLFG